MFQYTRAMKSSPSIYSLGTVLILIFIIGQTSGADYQFTGFFAPVKRFECNYLQRVKVIIPFFPNCKADAGDSDSDSDSSSSSSSSSSSEEEPEPEAESDDEAELPGVLGTASFTAISHYTEDVVTVEGVSCVDNPCTFTWQEDVYEDTDITMSYMIFTRSSIILASRTFTEHSETICDDSRMPRDSWSNIAWRLLSHIVAEGSDGCNITAGTYHYEEKDAEFYFTPKDKLPCERLTMTCNLFHKVSSERIMSSVMIFDLPEKSPNCTEPSKPESEEESESEPEPKSGEEPAVTTELT